MLSFLLSLSCALFTLELLLAFSLSSWQKPRSQRCFNTRVLFFKSKTCWNQTAAVLLTRLDLANHLVLGAPVTVNMELGQTPCQCIWKVLTIKLHFYFFFFQVHLEILLISYYIINNL